MNKIILRIISASLITALILGSTLTVYATEEISELEVVDEDTSIESVDSSDDEGAVETIVEAPITESEDIEATTNSPYEVLDEAEDQIDEAIDVEEELEESEYIEDSLIVCSLEDEGIATYDLASNFSDIDISSFSDYSYCLGSINVGDISGNYRSTTTKYNKGDDPGYDSNVVAILMSNNDIDITQSYYSWPSDTKMAIWLSGSGDMATLVPTYASGGYYSIWEACYNLSDDRYITKVYVDEGITSLSAPDLYYLSEIELPGSLTRLNDYAFSGSSNISFEKNDYRLPESITYIGTDAVSRSNGGLVTLPEGLVHSEASSITWIGYYIVAKTLGGEEIGRYYKSTTYGNPCTFDESTYTYYTSVSRELLDTSKIDVSDYVFDHCGVANGVLDLKLRPGSPLNEYVFYYSDKDAYNLTFLQEDGVTTIETLNLRRGDIITPPNELAIIAPEKEGKLATFAGWKDVDTHRIYGQSEIANVLFYSDATLKAYFTYEDVEKTYTVVFKDYDGSVVSENTYHYGESISVPECTLEYYLDGWNYTFTRWDAPVAKTCTKDQVYTPIYSKKIDTFKVFIVDTSGNKYDYIGSTEVIFDVSYGQTGAQIGKYWDTLKSITGNSYVCPESFRAANGLSSPSGSAIDTIYAKWTKSSAGYDPLKQYRIKGYTSNTDGFIPLDKLMSHIFKNEQTLMPVFEEVNYTTGHYAKVYSTYTTSMNFDGVTFKDEELLVTWYMGDDDYVILPLGNNGLNLTETKYGSTPDPGSFFYSAVGSIYGGCSNTFMENVMIVGNVSSWGPPTSNDYRITPRYSSLGPTVYNGYNLNLNYTVTNLDTNNDFRTADYGHKYFPDGPEDFVINLPEYPTTDSFDKTGMHYTNEYKWIISESYGLFEPFFADKDSGSITLSTDKWDEALTHNMQIRNGNIDLQVQVRPYFTETPIKYHITLLGKDGSIVLNKYYKYNDTVKLPTLSEEADKFYSYQPSYWYNTNDIADIYFMEDEIFIRKDLTLCMKYSAVPKDITNNFKVTLPLSLNLSKDSDNMLRASFDIGLSYEASIDETFINVETPDFSLTSNKGVSIPVTIKGRDRTKWHRTDLVNSSGNKYTGSQTVTLECDPKNMSVGEYEGILKFIITTGITD